LFFLLPLLFFVGGEGGDIKEKVEVLRQKQDGRY